jgi:hypothetical protein
VFIGKDLKIGRIEGSLRAFLAANTDETKRPRTKTAPSA